MIGLRLTPDTLRAAWDYLRTTPPFCRWSLPPGEEVEFHVSRTYPAVGEHRAIRRKRHQVWVSERRVKSTLLLMTTMAHEAIHAAQDIAGTTTPGAEHNADFQRRWDLVARHHIFDPGEE